MNGPLTNPRHPAFGDSETGSQVIDSEKLAQAARRQAALVAKAAAIGVVLALLLILGSVPRYSATETILLDEERNELLNQVSALPNAVRSDATVQSELEILRSQVLALEVVQRLNLDQDADFMNPPVGAVARVTGALSSVAGLFSGGGAEVIGPPVDPKIAAREAAAAALRQNLYVERVGRSFVLILAYSDHNPARAAAVARAYGDSYVQFQLTSQSKLAVNAGEWIDERLKVLAQRSLDATSAVQQFRARHNLVEFQGNLLTDQQQSDLTTALVTASADVAQLRARVQNFETLMKQDKPDVLAISALETLTPSDQTMSELRTDYIKARRNWTAIVAERGEEHPQAQQLKKQMTILETTIAEELDRAILATKAQYEIARSREASLRDDLSTFSERMTGDDKVMGQLAQLEAVADTYATVYRDFLERYEITAQQENFPIASVSIISPADMPEQPSSPKKKALVLLGLILGALVGIIIGALREMGPMRLRTPKDVVDRSGLTCAGLTPSPRRKLDTEARRVLTRTLTRARTAIDRMAKGDAETGRILAIVPVDAVGDAFPIGSFAEILSANGERVLVIDAGGLTPGQVGRLNAQDRVETWKLSDLPTRDNPTDRLRERFQTVLLCLPPLTRTNFPTALARAADASLLVLPWGSITPEFLEDATRMHGESLRPVATTILVGADLKRARLYMRQGDFEERLLHAV